MIDGIKAVCKGLDPQQWRGLDLLDFTRSVSIDTGEMRGNGSEAERYGLFFKITDTADGGGLCSFRGSLHRHRNKGAENSDLFTFEQVREEVEELERLYGIKSELADLKALEIGVNIPLEYRPVRLLNKALVHKRLELSRMRKKDKANGRVAARRRYAVKLYEKNGGLKDKDGNYILRFELSFNDLEGLRGYGVKTLSDLKNEAILWRLSVLLVEAAGEILFFDFKDKPQGLTERQLAKWWQYGSPNFWREERHGGHLTKKEYQQERKRYEDLRAKSGVFDIAEDFKKRVKKAVQKTRQNKRKKWVLLGIENENQKAEKMGTFGKLGLEHPKVTKRGKRGLSLLSEKKAVQNTTKKQRFCKTCGRDISEQNERSVFCSETLYGKEGKKCRNKDSNNRATKRRIIERAMKTNKTILVTYEFHGQEYTDELSPHELCLTREWVDRVKQVQVKEEGGAACSSTGEAARCLLWKLQGEAQRAAREPVKAQKEPKREKKL